MLDLQVSMCVCGGGGGELECEHIHLPTSPTFTHLFNTAPAHRTAQVMVGFAVSLVDGAEPTSTAALSGTVTKATPLRIRLVRPLPEIPYHGSARKAIHKSIAYKMLPEQEAWLEENAIDRELTLSQTFDSDQPNSIPPYPAPPHPPYTPF